MRDLIGLPEVAKMLGKSRQTAWELYKEGKIEPAFISGTDERPRPLFSRSSIERYIEKASQKEVA